MTKKLQPDQLPNWPRYMSLDLAAAYHSVSTGAFRAGVDSGKYPAPIKDGARVLWDKRRLDQLADIRSGFTDGGEEWEI